MRKTDNLREAEAVGVKWSPSMRKALDRLDTANRRKREASAMAQAGRRDLEEERLARKAEHDAEQARTKNPADFVVFPEPAVDLDLLHDIARAYDLEAQHAQRAVNAEAAD